MGKAFRDVKAALVLYSTFKFAPVVACGPSYVASMRRCLAAMEWQQLTCN